MLTYQKVKTQVAIPVELRLEKREVLILKPQKILFKALTIDIVISSKKPMAMIIATFNLILADQLYDPVQQIDDKSELKRKLKIKKKYDSTSNYFKCS